MAPRYGAHVWAMESVLVLEVVALVVVAMTAQRTLASSSVADRILDDFGLWIKCLWRENRVSVNENETE